MGILLILLFDLCPKFDDVNCDAIKGGTFVACT